MLVLIIEDSFANITFKTTEKTLHFRKATHQLEF